MTNFKNLAAAAALALFASSAIAGELVVTPVAEKSGGARVALDLASDGSVSGFNFVVKLDKTQLASVDLSNCVSELPKGFSGKCSLTKGAVYVFAMADGMTTLPAGVTSIGTLGFNDASFAKAGGASAVQIESLELADVNGQVVSSRAQIAK